MTLSGGGSHYYRELGADDFVIKINEDYGIRNNCRELVVSNTANISLDALNGDISQLTRIISNYLPEGGDYVDSDGESFHVPEIKIECNPIKDESESELNAVNSETGNNYLYELSSNVDYTDSVPTWSEVDYPVTIKEEPLDWTLCSNLVDTQLPDLRKNNAQNYLNSEDNVGVENINNLSTSYDENKDEKPKRVSYDNFLSSIRAINPKNLRVANKGRLHHSKCPKKLKQDKSDPTVEIVKHHDSEEKKIEKLNLLHFINNQDEQQGTCNTTNLHTFPILISTNNPEDIIMYPDTLKKLDEICSHEEGELELQVFRKEETTNENKNIESISVSSDYDSDEPVSGIYNKLLRVNAYEELPVYSRIRVRKDLMPKPLVERITGITVDGSRHNYYSRGVIDPEEFKRNHGDENIKMLFKKQNFGLDLHRIRSAISKMPSNSTVENLSTFLAEKLNKLTADIEHHARFKEKRNEYARMEVKTATVIDMVVKLKTNYLKGRKQYKMKHQVLKKKICCSKCKLVEAVFHCCWETYYCSVKCQKKDLANHYRRCRQVEMKINDPKLKANPLVAARLRAEGNLERLAEKYKEKLKARVEKRQAYEKSFKEKEHKRRIENRQFVTTKRKEEQNKLVKGITIKTIEIDKDRPVGIETTETVNEDSTSTSFNDSSLLYKEPLIRNLEYVRTINSEVELHKVIKETPVKQVLSTNKSMQEVIEIRDDESELFGMKDNRGGVRKYSTRSRTIKDRELKNEQAQKAECAKVCNEFVSTLKLEIKEAETETEANIENKMVLGQSGIVQQEVVPRISAVLSLSSWEQNLSEPYRNPGNSVIESQDSTLKILKEQLTQRQILQNRTELSNKNKYQQNSKTTNVTTDHVFPSYISIAKAVRSNSKTNIQNSQQNLGEINCFLNGMLNKSAQKANAKSTKKLTSSISKQSTIINQGVRPIDVEVIKDHLIEPLTTVKERIKNRIKKKVKNKAQNITAKENSYDKGFNYFEHYVKPVPPPVVKTKPKPKGKQTAHNEQKPSKNVAKKFKQNELTTINSNVQQTQVLGPRLTYNLPLGINNQQNQNNSFRKPRILNKPKLPFRRVLPNLNLSILGNQTSNLTYSKQLNNPIPSGLNSQYNISNKQKSCKTSTSFKLPNLNNVNSGGKFMSSANLIKVVPTNANKQNYFVTPLQTKSTTTTTSSISKPPMLFLQEQILTQKYPSTSANNQNYFVTPLQTTVTTSSSSISSSPSITKPPMLFLKNQILTQKYPGTSGMNSTKFITQNPDINSAITSKNNSTTSTQSRISLPGNSHIIVGKDKRYKIALPASSGIPAGARLVLPASGITPTTNQVGTRLLLPARGRPAKALPTCRTRSVFPDRGLKQAKALPASNLQGGTRLVLPAGGLTPGSIPPGINEQYFIITDWRTTSSANSKK